MDRQHAEAGTAGEAPYRALVESAPDIIALFDGEGRIRFINAAAARVLGYRPAEVVGRNLTEFVHPDDQGQALQQFAGHRDSPGSFAGPTVYRLRAADDGYRHLEVLSLNRLDAPDVDGICLVARDVSERLRRESERLVAHERRLLAAQVARVGIWEWNVRTRELVADEAVREIARQFPGQRWTNFEEFLERFVEEDRTALADALRGAARGGPPCRVVARLRLADGSLRWLQFHAQRLHPAENVNPWLVGLMMDVSDYKRTERELEEQRLRLDLALKGARLGLWDFDVSRGELYVDPRYSAITGLAAEAVRLEHTMFDQHTHEEDLPRLLEAGRACMTGTSDTLEFEGRLLTPDGRLTWVRLEGFVAARRPDGGAARMVGTIADVTLRRHHDQLAGIGETVTGVGSYEFDIGADRFYWSKGMYQLFGYPEDFVPLRRGRIEASPPGSREVMAEAFRGAIEDARGFDVEVETHTAAGTRIWVRDIARVESFQGRPVRIYGIVQDITRRKRLEHELLEVANREQQKLGRELHDGLGQELTGVSLLLQGMAPQVKAANPSLAPQLDRLAGLLSSAIRSTRALAHGLAPVSTSRGGLEAALRMLAAQSTEAYGVPVTLELALQRPLELGEVAGLHLYRIAQEALSNAMRHGQPSQVIIRLGSSAERITLEVLDDGRGPGGTAHGKEGMGLQSMAFRAASLLGSLSVEERPQGGTRILVTIPGMRG